MSNEMSLLEGRINALEVRLKFLEGRTSSDMAAIVEMMGAQGAVDGANNKEVKEEELAEFRIQLARMTPKQHVTLQMVIGYIENEEIGKVIGSSVNSAKMIVKNISVKMGLSARGEVREKARRLLMEVDAAEYLRMSKGIPLNWWAEREEPDRYAPIYLKARGEK